jgi:uncharacterized membrane protein
MMATAFYGEPSAFIGFSVVQDAPKAWNYRALSHWEILMKTQRFTTFHLYREDQIWLPNDHSESCA